MATKKKRGAKSSAASKAPLERLRVEAQRLIAKNSGEVRKNLARLQKQLQTSAERTVRELEQRLLKRLHAATEAQVKRLEQRVATLEKAAARPAAPPAAGSGQQAA